MSRREIHSLVDIRMPSHRTPSNKVWTAVAILKHARCRSIDEAIALRRCEAAKRASCGCCRNCRRFSLQRPVRRLHKIGDICTFRGCRTNMLQGPIVLFAKRKKGSLGRQKEQKYEIAQLATLKIIHDFVNTSNTKHMSMNESLVL